MHFPRVITTRHHWWLVNNVSGNGLVHSGTKPQSQCRPRSMLPYSVATPQWVNKSWKHPWICCTMGLISDCYKIKGEETPRGAYHVANKKDPELQTQSPSWNYWQVDTLNNMRVDNPHVPPFCQFNFTTLHCQCMSVKSQLTPLKYSMGQHWGQV